MNLHDVFAAVFLAYAGVGQLPILGAGAMVDRFFGRDPNQRIVFLVVFLDCDVAAEFAWPLDFKPAERVARLHARAVGLQPLDHLLEFVGRHLACVWHDVVFQEPCAFELALQIGDIIEARL